MIKLRTGDIVVTKDVTIGTENRGKWPLFMIIGQLYDPIIKNPLWHLHMWSQENQAIFWLTVMIFVRLMRQ